MPEKTLIAIVRAADDAPGTWIVASPVVGRTSGAPAPGVYLNPADAVLGLDILNERYVLRLPRDVRGWVAETFVPPALSPVAYNTPLVRLDPRALEPDGSPAGGAGTRAGPADEATAGLMPVVSPTEGIFYRRSAPDSPPYVEEGAKIATGAVLGLVEVMKCFNPITYGGPGYPERVEIARILVQDAAEVQFGQTLFWVRPLD